MSIDITAVALQCSPISFTRLVWFRFGPDGSSKTREIRELLLQVVREYLHTGACLRLNIDATFRGNVARFFNHACDGGSLDLTVVRRRCVADRSSMNVAV